MHADTDLKIECRVVLLQVCEQELVLVVCAQRQFFVKKNNVSKKLLRHENEIERNLHVSKIIIDSNL